MRDLVDTTEMYLRTVYELEEEDIVPLRARIAERLEQSGPTVSQTVARMERDGLLVVRPDRSLHLTDTGRAKATAVMRKHRLAERLLTDVLKLDLDKVHEEACRWEHVMSDEVELKVVDLLDDVTRSPFGNPIPGLEELGVEVDEEPDPGVRAVDLPLDKPLKVEIVQLNEIMQIDQEQIREFRKVGIAIGSEVELVNHGTTVSVTTPDGETVNLPEDLAHALRVSKPA